MRKIGIIAVLSLMALALAAVPALAAAPDTGNAHFIKSATFATRSGNDLIVNFKETGLASGSVETITVSATATTTYSCVNNGTNIPSDKKKTRTTSPVSNSGTFPADRSGTVQSSLTLSPPTAAQVGLTCPSGQTATLISVTYTNVMVVDSTSGASFSIAGTF
jgi:hypothetical protein